MTLGLNCIDPRCRRYRYDSNWVGAGIGFGSACANMDIVGTVDGGFVEVAFGYVGVVDRVHQDAGPVYSETERVVVVVEVAAVIVETP
jgi:hypothetical protein